MIEILQAGKYTDMYGREVEITEQDVADIERNYYLLMDYIKPPLKLGHADKQALDQNDGQPALGWLSMLKKHANKLTAQFENIPQALKDAVNQKRYKRVSPEISFNASKISGLPDELRKQIKGPILTALALLGADIPAIKSLADLPLLASEKQDGFYLFQEVKMEDEKKVDLVQENESLKAQISDLQNKLKQAENGQNLAFSEMKSSLTEMQNQVSALMDENKILQESRIKLQERDNIDAITKLSSGRLFPIEVQKYIEKVNGGEIKLSTAQELISLMPADRVKIGTVGHSNDVVKPDPAKELEAKIIQLSEKRPEASYSELLSAAIDENPHLAAQLEGGL